MNQARAGRHLARVVPGALAMAVLLAARLAAAQTIPAAHVYHNHMPNFWPYYANSNAEVVAKYQATAVGAPIRYTSDGDVIKLKQSPPAGYPYYLPATVGTGPMPHDDLVSYYSHHAKYQCYQSYPPNFGLHGWPLAGAEQMQSFAGGNGQVHVTFSGALATNVNSLETGGAISGVYTNGTSWNAEFVTDFNNLKTKNGYQTLDMLHFTGHHSLGPLVGGEYFLKDLIAHGATLAQPWFLGSSYRSSRGFFPTELSFSTRLIPALSKLGIQWSVVGNNHFSHVLQDYPYADYDANLDCSTSPPNRADLRNTSTVGSWVSAKLTNQAIPIVNKFPFASTPHWVRHVDPLTGAAYKLAAIPSSQNGQWEEGYNGSVTVAEYLPYASLEPRQFYVLAHDGDNSSGRSGSWDTWQAGTTVTGSGSGYNLGVDEYLKKFPIPAADVAHVQDGSWADVLDASTDPMFYHWHQPFLIWKGQFADFNKATGLSLAPKTSLTGIQDGATVTFEQGWHYQELAFAKLQPALNYAVTAEQIWLDNHPTHWSPTTTLDAQVTYAGNQLNPWMIAAPVKGDPAADYKGGANPAELAWYFLLPAMDSGFGYYGENQDDDVKPVLSFNNSLAFSKPYVANNLSQDRTGPSVWVPQRWPGNPGSVNASKAEGWTVHWFSNKFAVYTYAYDAAGMGTVNLMVRPHTIKTISATDDTYKVVYPSLLAGTPGLSITPASVGSWTAYPMRVRDLRPVMNGVDWVPTEKATMAVLPATEIGSLYYAYLDQYRDQLVDYYIQATDAWGNVTSTDIQQVYVGAGRYNPGGKSGYVESASGTVVGTDPFITAGAVATPTTAVPDFLPASGSYAATQAVQIVDATPGAVIYYTLDGSTPTTASAKYTGPITVSSSSILTAMAATSGLPQSGKSSATYLIGAPLTRTAAPTFSPAPGVYASAQSVALSSVTPGAAIYYTADGSAPSTASARYTAPIAVSATTTLRAIALATGFGQSVESSGAFVIGSAPAAPTGVSAATTSTSSITVSWTASSGATSYLVERATASAGPFTAAGTTTSTSLVATGLTSGTTYWFRVTASNAAGSSPASALASAKTQGWLSTYPAMALRGSMNGWATTSMALVADYTWQVAVTLTASTAYTYKYDASGAWTTGQNWGAGSTSGVAAVNGGNISYTAGTAGSYVFQFNDKTLAYSVTVPAPTIPLAPTNVAATPVSGTQINLTWTASTGAASYTVNRGASSNGPFVVAGSPTGTSFSDTGLTPGQQYFYYLTATNSAGTSTGSVAVYATTLTPPTAPTAFTATVVSSSRIDLTWGAPAGASSYTISRATAAAGPFTQLGTSTSASYSATGLTGNTTYWFQVTATGAGGTSAASTVSATTLPGSTFTSTYPSMNLRGSMNAWGSTAMALTANNTWQVQVALTAGTVYTYKYDVYGNWGSGTNWGDSNADGIGDAGGSNISYTAPTTGTYVFQFNDSTRAYAITPPGGTCATVAVTFSIANANTASGQNLYVVGSVAALGSWTAASGFALTIQGTGANATWSGTVQLPPGTAIQYKYVKRNPSTGAATWESNQTTTSGNREKTTAACGATSTFADGNFKS